MMPFEIIPVRTENIVVRIGHSKLDLTGLEKLNPPREDGYPKVKELKPSSLFKTDAKDPNYNKPLSALEKEY